MSGRCRTGQGNRKKKQQSEWVYEELWDTRGEVGVPGTGSPLASFAPNSVEVECTELGPEQAKLLG